ncbi:FAD-dependent monooxygenase [Nocardioides sp. W7]|uniref:FAD-dependent monooxygenase n=1 Tax=Nocardioides sp. W7 TaxID=2931390 RepID=UPI001FD4CB5A|nr:FAD-dependent monooxygenase [Nocardioides sp. W7]
MDEKTRLERRDDPLFEQMHTVAVAGMGPVGMVAALSLARIGHDVIVFEAGAALSAEARASTFHPSTLELLDELGVSEALHRVGLRAPIYQYRRRGGGVLSEMDMSLLSAETRFPYRLQSEQNNLTALILDELRKLPNVTLSFASPVARVERSDRHVRIHLEGRNRDEPVLARWLIAADGASSVIRKSLGIAFEGTTYDERFLVISTTHDFRDDFPDLAYVSYISDPEEWGVLLRTPKHWRALFPVSSDESDEQAMAPEALERRLQRIAPQSTPYEVVHANVYAVNMRAAATFASGQVLLAGDAAHVNNPLGGMGMNSGIHDAWAAAKCIDAALTGTDARHAATLYSELRRDAALHHVQATAQVTYDTMREPDDRTRSFRAAELSVAENDELAMREHQRGAAMFTSLRITTGRLARELRAVPDGRMAPGQRLSRLLCRGPVAAVGAYDGVSATLVARAGFDAVYLSGAAVSAAVLGQPDLGYLGLADMAEQVRRVSTASGLPLVVDGDTGYGGVLQVAEAVRRFEAAGAAAVQLEDQAAPKRCGHLAGKELLDLSEMVAKVEIAAAERSSLLVIARTDAMTVEGFSATLKRASAYAAAGADLIFAEGVYAKAELLALREAVGGTPLVVSLSEAGDHSDLPADRILSECGVALVIQPVSALLASAKAVATTYDQVRRGGSSGWSPQDWSDFTELMGQPEQLARAAALANDEMIPTDNLRSRS